MSDPTLNGFLTGPVADVARVAPATLVYAAAGTRRAAALAGIGSTGDEFAAWSLGELRRACALIFDHGVQHIFTILAAPGQFAEVGPYRQRLLDWITWGLGSAEALAGWQALGWRVRLVSDLAPVAGQPATPERTFDPALVADPALTALQARLAGLPVTPGAPTLWCLVLSDPERLWRYWLACVLASGARTRAEAIRAVYGEDVPLATLYLSFGKPVIAPDLLPPLLTGKVDCYWTQKPGYSLSQDDLRAILYDYAYVRPTWQADKTHRAEAVLATRAAWEHGPTLGLGTRLGPFWYPQLPQQQP